MKRKRNDDEFTPPGAAKKRKLDHPPTNNQETQHLSNPITLYRATITKMIDELLQKNHQFIKNLHQAINPMIPSMDHNASLIALEIFVKKLSNNSALWQNPELAQMIQSLWNKAKTNVNALNLHSFIDFAYTTYIKNTPLAIKDEVINNLCTKLSNTQPTLYKMQMNKLYSILSMLATPSEIETKMCNILAKSGNIHIAVHSSILATKELKTLTNTPSSAQNWKTFLIKINDLDKQIFVDFLFCLHLNTFMRCIYLNGASKTLISSIINWVDSGIVRPEKLPKLATFWIAMARPMLSNKKSTFLLPQEHQNARELRTGIDCMEKRNFLQAIEHLNKQQQDNQINNTTRNACRVYTGMALYEIGNYNEAIKNFEASLWNNQQKGPIFYMLGMTYLTKTKKCHYISAKADRNKVTWLNQAQKYFKKATESGNNYFYVYLRLGETLHWLYTSPNLNYEKKISYIIEAINQYKLALLLRPDSPEAIGRLNHAIYLSIFTSKKGIYNDEIPQNKKAADMARKTYTEVIAKYKQHNSTVVLACLQERAKIYTILERNDLAIKDYKSILEKNPQNEQIKNKLQELLQESNKQKQERQDFMLLRNKKEIKSPIEKKSRSNLDFQ